MPSPKRSPRKDASPGKESLKKKLSSKDGSPAKESLKSRSSYAPSEDRPSSTDFSKLTEPGAEDVALEPPLSPSQVKTSSPSKPSLLDLAKMAVHAGKWEPGMPTDEHGAGAEKGHESDIALTSDDEAGGTQAQSSWQTSFDETPVCHSGDEMSPRVVKTYEYTTEAAKPAPSPKHAAAGGSGTLDKKDHHNPKDAMKKTGKTMKEASKKIGKMFKFGGGKDSPKTKKKDKKADHDKEETKKGKEGKVTFSPKTKAAKKGNLIEQFIFEIFLVLIPTHFSSINLWIHETRAVYSKKF